MEPFVGQIISVGFNFAPQGWFLCNGQIQPIANFAALFQLIGTTYGGDGQSTFAVPNLQGRVPLHDGQGTGLSNYVIGTPTGTEFVTLLSNQLGAHNHLFAGSAKFASSPSGITPGPTTTLGLPVIPDNIALYGPAPGIATLAPASIGQSGSGNPHENRQPYLAVNFIIAWAGIFPSRN